MNSQWRSSSMLCSGLSSKDTMVWSLPAMVFWPECEDKELFCSLRAFSIHYWVVLDIYLTCVQGLWFPSLKTRCNLDVKLKTRSLRPECDAVHETLTSRSGCRRALAVQKIVKPIQEALGVIYCFGAHCSLLWNLNIVFMEDDNFFKDFVCSLRERERAGVGRRREKQTPHCTGNRMRDWTQDPGIMPWAEGRC